MSWRGRQLIVFDWLAEEGEESAYGMLAIPLEEDYS